jgi:hypothetical protein
VTVKAYLNRILVCTVWVVTKQKVQIFIFLTSHSNASHTYHFVSCIISLASILFLKKGLYRALCVFPIARRISCTCYLWSELTQAAALPTYV